MKKFFALFLSLMMLFSVSALAETVAVDMSAPTFEVGEDETEYVVDGASGWNSPTVFVKITAGEEELYNGTVKLTSDKMLASEFTLAAIYEIGCGQEGVESGFISYIDDYANGPDADGNYVSWFFSVNGKDAPFACNQVVLQEGDYLWWDYHVYSEENSFNAMNLPCGFAAPFEVGEDETEYEVDGASGWTSGNIYVKISAGDTVIYNGVVALTSDNLFVSEASKAAAYEAGVSFDGFDSGFVNYIDEFRNATTIEDKTYYWTYSVNGQQAMVSCNEFRLLDGYYVEWNFVGY